MENNFHLVVLPVNNQPFYIGYHHYDDSVDIIQEHIKGFFEILATSEVRLSNVHIMNNSKWRICSRLFQENLNIYAKTILSSNNGEPNMACINNSVVFENENNSKCIRCKGSAGAASVYKYKNPYLYGNLVLEIPATIWNKYNLNSEDFI
jgi:hypothetical protein